MYKKQIENILENCVANKVINGVLGEYGIKRIIEKPIIGVANEDDRIFDKYKEVVGPLHFKPRELWDFIQINNDSIERKLSVISIVFPFNSEIRQTYKEGDKWPSEIYSLARHFTDSFINQSIDSVIKFIESHGFIGINPSKTKVYKIENTQNVDTIYSTWSERHIAFAAGLGTFSLHEALITEAGCNVRLGSILTDMPLEVTNRKSDFPYGNCLYFVSGKCKECIKNCPANALSEKGHDKTICFDYRTKARNRLKSILKDNYKGKEEIKDLRAGCALCQFNVPCMEKNPVKDFKEYGINRKL